MYTITRQIGIDAAHRVPDHKSKCFNVHGHRYTIEATCVSRNLHASGEQTGMVLDFSFLKEEMMQMIHDPCDHATILYVDDPLLRTIAPEDLEFIRQEALQDGYTSRVLTKGWKLYVIDAVPTAENLAEHWFMMLRERITYRSSGVAQLQKIKVYETPNCFAEYSGG